MGEISNFINIECERVHKGKIRIKYEIEGNGIFIKEHSCSEVLQCDRTSGYFCGAYKTPCNCLAYTIISDAIKTIPFHTTRKL